MSKQKKVGGEDLDVKVGGVDKLNPPETPKKKEEKLVQISESVLEDMQKSIARLTAAADVSRLAKFDSNEENKKRVIQTAKVSFIDNKPVVATKLIEDDVFVDSHGIYHEKQIMKVFYEGGETQEMSYKEFIKLVIKKTGEIIKREKDREDNEVFVIRMSDGKKIVVDGKFIN